MNNVTSRIGDDLSFDNVIVVVISRVPILAALSELATIIYRMCAGYGPRDIMSSTYSDMI